MRIRFVVSLSFFALLPQLALCQQPANSQPDGRAVFMQHCAQCHGDQGQGVKTIISLAGPPLIAVHDRQHVIEMVRDGKDIMPTFSRVLSAQQIGAVAEYVVQHLAVLSITGGNVAQGGELFRVYCAPCHRTAVRGGILAYAGVNPPPLVDKTPSEVAGAIRWGPGPMPAFPASEISDKQLASIVAYVDFAKSPPHPGGTPMNWFGPVAEGFVAWIALFFLVVMSAWIEKGGKG